MKQALAIFLLACMALAAGAQVPLHMDVETSEARTRYLDVFRGESVALELAFKSYGKPLAFTDGTPATIFWQTNGMAAAWWTAPATTTTNGLVSAAWTPAMDCGAASYALFVGVGETSRMYRASFQVRLRGAPGYPTNPLPMPVEVIDFAAVAWTNAPWALPYAAGDNIVITNGVISSGGGGLAEEKDPAFQTWRDESEDTPWTLRDDINRVAGLVDDLPGAVAAATNAVFADVKSYVNGVGGSIELHIDRGLAGLEGTLKGEIAASTNGAIRHLSASMNTMEGLIYDNMINWDAETLAAATNYTDKALEGVSFDEEDPVFKDWRLNRRELHADSWTNIVWKNVYSNGWVYLVPYSNNLEDAE